MSLGRQFRLLRETYPPDGYEVGNAGQRDYYLVDQDDQQHARMSVVDYSNSPKRRIGWNETHPYSNRGPNEGFNGADRMGQHVLFAEHYDTPGGGKPGQSKVMGAYMTRGARAMAMPMLAQAHHDTVDMGRKEMTASDNLSPRSAPLVARLQERGLVDENAVNTPTNDVDFWAEPYAYLPKINDEVVDLGRAKARARSILKHTRVPKPETIEQMRLSGLD